MSCNLVEAISEWKILHVSEPDSLQLDEVFRFMVKPKLNFAKKGKGTYHD